MKPITEDIKERLLANWRDGREAHRPVVKFFDPTGAAIWLVEEMSPEDNDILFGLCDLGLGFPELGYVSLRELEGVSGMAGLGIERDLHFEAGQPLSVYAEAARRAGRIVENEKSLAEAAAALKAARRRGRP
jgi:hypothetical protein